MAKQYSAGTWVLDNVKPLLSHLNPDYALSSQLRVDREELSSKCVMMDHLLSQETWWAYNKKLVPGGLFNSLIGKQSFLLK